MDNQRPFDQMTDAELGAALTELGKQVNFPPTPNLVGAVGARINSEPRSHGWRSLLEHRWSLTLRPMLVVAVILLLVIATLVVSPKTRQVVADRLGVPGLLVEFLGAAPTPAVSPVVETLLLGQRVTLQEAVSEVNFAIQAPTVEWLGEPAEIYVSRPGDRPDLDPMVSFVYLPGPTLPDTTLPGVGALLTQFPGETDRNLIYKGLEPTAQLEMVMVNGAPALWIEGPAHHFAFIDPNGVHAIEALRLADHTLLWVHDGLTFRLESALERNEAIAIAESIQIVSET